MPTRPSSQILCLLACVPAMVQPAHAQNPSTKKEATKVTINVLPGLIKFETTQFDVPAGGPVKLTFSNDCVMPHNLVLLKADAEPALVAGVNAMGLEGMEKNFVPEVPGIIAATKILQPATTENLSFTAPKEAGDYPYLCTFPGHWFTMRGIMRVRAEGQKLEASVKSAEKVPQVPDALKTSGMSHKPMGTPEKAFVMRTFAPDPGLDPAVFAHHGVGTNAVKYDPATRMDLTEKVTDPATGTVREVPIIIKPLKGVAGAIAVNQGPSFSYVWDSTECRLLYVWRNGFLDMDTYWGKEPGSGRPKVYLPLIMGNLVYKASGPMPQASPGDPPPRFLGYSMQNGIPEFRYEVGKKIFRERVLPQGDSSFQIKLSHGENKPSNITWKVPPADTSVTQVKADANGLSVTIQDRPEPVQPAAKKADTQKKN